MSNDDTRADDTTPIGSSGLPGVSLKFDLLTRAEAARLLRVSMQTFDRHVRPQLPEVKMGRRLLFRRFAIQEWLSREPEAPAVPTRAGNTRAQVVPAPAPLGVVRLNDPRVIAKRAELRAKREKAQQAKADREARAAKRPTEPAPL